MRRSIAATVAVALVLVIALAPAARAEMPLRIVQAAQQKQRVVDINSASQKDLESLSGVGPATAKKIVDGRPYQSKDELVRKNIMPQSTYDKIKDRMVARQKK